MEQQGQKAASQLVESLTGWWNLAGLDGIVGEETVNWLAEEVACEDLENQQIVRTQKIESVPTFPSCSEPAWPTNIAELNKMIIDGAPLPGNIFGSRSVAPAGPVVCDVMVISDLPDMDDVAAGDLDAGASAILLRRMLAAINIDLSACYWATLATTRPPTGEISAEFLPHLADFMRHQIALVKPQSLILLGSSACNALLSEELLKARQILANINHDGNNMTAMTTFHPRTLIARPVQKALAWRDLQMFAQRAGS